MATPGGVAPVRVTTDVTGADPSGAVMVIPPHVIVVVDPLQFTSPPKAQFTAVVLEGGVGHSAIWSLIAVGPVEAYVAAVADLQVRSMSWYLAKGSTLGQAAATGPE
jgi:hypothetical protein